MRVEEEDLEKESWDQWADWVWESSTGERLWRYLLPPPETVVWHGKDLYTHHKYSTWEKVAHVARGVFCSTLCILLLPATLLLDWYRGAKVEHLSSRQAPDPKRGWLPERHGFACSLFQTAGLGLSSSPVPGVEGRCDWEEWLQDPAHLDNPENKPLKEFFVDVLSNPVPYAQALREMGCTAHRLSFEQAVLQKAPGEDLDPVALAMYKNLLKAFAQEGIAISGTVQHFVVPAWFRERGGWQNRENIELYLDYAQKLLTAFPEVEEWWSFNELGVKAFQQCFREVYPTDIPEGSFFPSRADAAGKAMEAMLMAHCRLHEWIRKQQLPVIVGVTHQWLQSSLASGNFLERTVNAFLEAIAFWPVYGFLLSGRFSYQLPLLVNRHFVVAPEVWKRLDHCFDEVGVQAYPGPYLKFGWNGGEAYPGIPGKIHNIGPLTFGATCPPGGTFMRFGPAQDAKRIHEILDEAFALGKPVVITEFGSDSTVMPWGSTKFQRDRESQARFLRELFQEIGRYCEAKEKSLSGIFVWSDLSRQLEWENGHECGLGILEQVLDEESRLVSIVLTPAGRVVQEEFAVSE